MIFDHYDSLGTMAMGECREKALEEVGYDLITCEHCNGNRNTERLKDLLPTVKYDGWLFFAQN